MREGTTRVDPSAETYGRNMTVEGLNLEVGFCKGTLGPNV